MGSAVSIGVAGLVDCPVACWGADVGSSACVVSAGTESTGSVVCMTLALPVLVVLAHQGSGWAGRRIVCAQPIQARQQTSTSACVPAWQDRRRHRQGNRDSTWGSISAPWHRDLKWNREYTHRLRRTRPHSLRRRMQPRVPWMHPSGAVVARCRHPRLQRMAHIAPRWPMAQVPRRRQTGSR